MMDDVSSMFCSFGGSGSIDLPASTPPVLQIIPTPHLTPPLSVTVSLPFKLINFRFLNPMNVTEYRQWTCCDFEW